MDKKYYWIKLKSDFFDEKYIRTLRRLPSGDSIVVIYLHIMVRCLESQGVYYFDKLAESIEDEIAIFLNEDANLVKLTITALEKLNLIERGDNCLYLVGIPVGSIGSETSVAERVRRYRNKQKDETKALQCNTDVTNCNVLVTKCNTDIDKDIEINSIENRDNTKIIELDNNIQNIKDKESIIKYLIDDGLLKEDELENYPYKQKIYSYEHVLTYGLIAECAHYTLNRLPRALKNRYDLFERAFTNKIEEARQNEKLSYET